MEAVKEKSHENGFSDQELETLLKMFDTPIEDMVDHRVLDMLTNRFDTSIAEIGEARDMEDARHVIGRALKRTFLLGRWSVRH